MDRGAIAPRVTATSKRQALSVVAEVAARAYRLDAGKVFEALSEREQAGSTGVGHGVAVPHARMEGLQRLAAVFVRLEQPIAFEAVDDKPVDLLFGLLAPKDAGADHLRALARVSRLMRQGDVRERLRQARTVDAIRALLVEDARPSAA
ncbi:MAG: PTS sugar transporter subunit IIA [Caulobacteraceae bacterium]|nr:PTS sugar transporter subunit IIA [Caulobacteraceae bacterium]